MKLIVDAFLIAAEKIDNGTERFSCNSLKRVLRDEFGTRYSDYTPEMIFYQNLFGIRCGDTFIEVAKRQGIYSLEDIEQLRILALCFAAELARWKNNKK